MQPVFSVKSISIYAKSPSHSSKTDRFLQFGISAANRLTASNRHFRQLHTAPRPQTGALTKPVVLFAQYNFSAINCRFQYLDPCRSPATGRCVQAEPDAKQNIVRAGIATLVGIRQFLSTSNCVAEILNSAPAKLGFRQVHSAAGLSDTSETASAFSPLIFAQQAIYFQMRGSIFANWPLSAFPSTSLRFSSNVLKSQ